MTIHKHSISIAVCAAALAAVASAQEQPAVRATPVSAADYCSISKVLGATVQMNPGAEARREAEKDGDIAKKPEGKIDDVIVDGLSGEMKYAIVSFGGFVGIGDKTVAVPCTALTWVPAHERFELAASEDRLKALPAFDLSKARKSGIDAAAVTIDSQWQTGTVNETGATKGETKDASAPRADRDTMPAKDPIAKPEAKPVDGTPFHLVPTRFVCGSEIDDHAVYAGSEKFGKISDLLVDRGQRTVALAVVKRGGALGIGGTEYLVPYRALHFCTSGDEKVHCLTSDSRKLETAVLYEKPKEGIVDAEAARKALASDTFDKVRKEGAVKTDKDHPHDKR